jgi:hypothetical protein
MDIRYRLFLMRDLTLLTLVAACPAASNIQPIYSLLKFAKFIHR